MSSARKFALWLLVLDAAALVAVFNILGWARGLYWSGEFLVQPFLLPLGVLVVALYLIDGYKLRTDMLSVNYTSEHTIALLSVLGVMSIIVFFLLTDFYLLQQSRGVLVAGYLILIPLTLGYRRFLYGRLIHDRRDYCFLFLGPQDAFDKFSVEYAESRTTQRLVHVAHVDDSSVPAGGTGLRRALQDNEGRIDGIIIREAGFELPTDVAQELVELHFSGVPSYTLELFHEVYWRKIPLYRLNQTWLFQEGFAVAREPFFERAKRISDLLFALFGLVIASPLFVIVPVLIWLDDRGPVFFRQSRTGLNRQAFQLAKFRTMRVGGAADGPVYTQVGDKRITRIGGFLRKSRIDEIPQLWNVFMGDMSLIGPRAEWTRLVDDYERTIPCYHFRHLVRPGITGWAQVNYPYGASKEDAMRKLEYDLYYIRHFSFRLDASIILKTIHLMLFGKGR
jgi:exopolysaccharide biosynthesis polyprenyl glycosylphosphotransferase